MDTIYKKCKASKCDNAVTMEQYHGSGLCDECHSTIDEPVYAPNDGSNSGTSHYDLPKGATELKHLIWHKDMNAQVGEIFRSAWRLGTATHSSKQRDLRKIIAYAEQELERLEICGEKADGIHE